MRDIIVDNFAGGGGASTGAGRVRKGQLELGLSGAA